MISLEKAGVRRAARWIFRDLSLSLGAGQCLCVLGPNGRGKTTLIKALAGLAELHEGRRAAPGTIGYVSQAIQGSLAYRCIDVVVMGRATRLGLFGAPSRDDYRVAQEALDCIDAGEFAQRLFDRLSGGERQIVLLARALATGSRALILDEPASALDLANQNRLLMMLSRLKAEGRHAIIFSTHLPQHALHIADQALLMMEGLEYVAGPVHAVMNEANLSRLYGVPVRRLAIRHERGPAVEAMVPIFGFDAA